MHCMSKLAAAVLPTHASPLCMHLKLTWRHTSMPTHSIAEIFALCTPAVLMPACCLPAHTCTHAPTWSRQPRCSPGMPACACPWSSPLKASARVLTLSPDVLSSYVLSPYILSRYVLSPNVVSPYVLSPNVLSPDVLSPNVQSPYILSPYILSPYVLSPYVQSPYVQSPYILPPYVLSPYILPPYVLSPYVLSPCVLSPYILSPYILSPYILSPYMLSPYLLSLYILSPCVFSPYIQNLAMHSAISRPCSRAHAQVSDVQSKLQQRQPAAPFITSTLQQEASRRLGFGASWTMATAQALYEGSETGKAHVLEACEGSDRSEKRGWWLLRGLCAYECVAVAVT